jgi:signal transduction histidine kinase
MHSLQSRLGIGLLLSLLAVFSVQWLLVSRGVRLLAEHYISTRLEHDAEDLLRGVVLQPAVGLREAAIDPIFHQPFSGHYYRIAIGEQVFRSRSLWDQELAVPAVSNGVAKTQMLPGPQGQTLLVWAMGFSKQGRNIGIAVAEDFTPVEADLRRFELGYAAASALALALLIALQVFTVRRGLRPLNRTRAQLGQLDRGEVSTLDENVPREVQPLVQELNRLLESLRQRLQRSRNALGNLTHAMKIPLALLRQVAEREELRAQPEIRAQLVKQTDILHQLTERELKRARLAGHATPGQRLRLEPEVRALVDSLEAIYRHKQLAIHYQLPAGYSTGMDREDLLEMLGNLMDNACKWAQREVSLQIDSQEGLQISVADDGPGCAPEELARLTGRGVRIDEDTAGHGLGLAIVQDIVNGYGGDIRFARSAELGGLQVQVRIPA